MRQNIRHIVRDSFWVFVLLAILWGLVLNKIESDASRSVEIHNSNIGSK